MSSSAITVCETYGAGGRCRVVIEGGRVKIIRKNCNLGRASEFTYFIINDEILHASQLPGSRVAKVDGNDICWVVPGNVIAGKYVLEVSFSRRRGEPMIRLHKVRNEIIGNNELDKVTETADIDIKQFINQIRDGKLRFKYFGGEVTYSELYFNEVPRFIDEFRNNLRQCGLNWFIRSDVESLLVEDPGLEYVHSMIFPLENSRITALYSRIAKSYELWILSEVIKALCDAHGKPQKGAVADVEIHGRRYYKPVITFSFGDKCVHVLYQVDVVTHMTRMLDIEHAIERSQCMPRWLPECVSKCGGKRVHTAPDIMLMVTNCGEKVVLECRGPYTFRMPITWQYSDKLPLIIEVKLGIFRAVGRTGLSEYEELGTAVKQVCMYKCLLRDRPRIAVVVHEEVTEDVRNELARAGAHVIDGLAPGNDKKVRDFLDVIRGSLAI